MENVECKEQFEQAKLIMSDAKCGSWHFKQGFFEMKLTSEITSFVCALIAAASAITVAVPERRAARELKSTEKRAARRARESRLSMDMMYASMGLAMDTAKALRDGHTNGTLEPDLDTAQAARAAYDAFLRDEAAAAVAKR